jgi:hypothetical protein
MSIKLIKFSNNFEKDSYGARRTYVEDAIRHADGSAEGLSEKEREEKISAYLTLHTRAIKRASSTAFVWLIFSRVEAYIQTVLVAFRAFSEDVKIDDPTDAVACVRSFVAVFGIEADWGTGMRTRFVEHATVAGEPSAFLNGISNALINEERSRKFHMVAPLKVPTPGQIELRWSFVLNDSLYGEAMRRHLAN